MKRLLLTICVLLITTCGYAQKSKNEADFEWLKTTFEQNDAGFSYILEKKGKEAYALHNAITLEKIRAATDRREFMEALDQWLSFFRGGHIGIFGDWGTPPATERSEPFYRQVDVDIPRFLKYAAGLKDPGMEGVWQLNTYKIGIRKDADGGHTGFIIESESDKWTPGQIKLLFAPQGAVSGSVLYMGDHTPQPIGQVSMLGCNYIDLGNYRLRRLSPALPVDVSVERYIKSVSSWEPYLDIIDEKTLLLRIPAFDLEYKAAIDSVLKANMAQIKSTENLIIDLSGNGGGADRSFSNILPLIYTGPIRNVSVEFLSTKVNNRWFYEYATNPEYGLTDSADQYMALFHKLEARLGEFVPLGNQPVSIYRRDAVEKFPCKVAIIIDGGCASTTEQFLLAARQSGKVKLMGQSTAGALDISNVRKIFSPDKSLALSYCVSRSFRLPGLAIDDVGIQPDYFFDRTIERHKWIDLAADILNGNL